MNGGMDGARQSHVMLSGPYTYFVRDFVCCDDDDDDNVQNITSLLLSLKSSLKSKKGAQAVACLPCVLILLFFLFPHEQKDRFLSSLATHPK